MRPKLLKLFKKGGETLLHAFRVLDHDTRHSQTQERKTKRHPVVVIGLNLCPVKPGWVNP